MMPNDGSFPRPVENTDRSRIGINTLISRALLFCDAQFDREFYRGGR